MCSKSSLHRFDQFEPVHFRHLKVGDDNFDGLRFQDVDRQSPVGDVRDLVSAFFQEQPDFHCLRGTIFDKQYFRHVSVTLGKTAGKRRVRTPSMLPASRDPSSIGAARQNDEPAAYRAGSCSGKTIELLEAPCLEVLG